MLKKIVASGAQGQVIVMDSITQVAPDDAGRHVVSASHGGTSSGVFALAVTLKLVLFNDAGVGKDQAGIAALAMLQGQQVPAATVAHTSARIGDSQDMWDHGVLSHVNEAARLLGLRPGQAIKTALTRLVQG